MDTKGGSDKQNGRAGKDSYGMSRGGKGVEKTVNPRDEASMGGGDAETSSAAASIYRGAVNNTGGNKSASLPALQER